MQHLPHVGSSTILQIDFVLGLLSFGSRIVYTMASPRELRVLACNEQTIYSIIGYNLLHHVNIQVSYRVYRQLA